eukprot:6404240-Lingulodinium_polyedra.AAC.1
MALGHVGFSGLLTCRVKEVDHSAAGHYFQVDVDAASFVEWKHVVDFKVLQVWPSEVVSPLHYFIRRRRKLGPGRGILLRVTGAPVEPLVHAAKHCFFDQGLEQLKKLCTALEVTPAGP